ncbi:MAG: hypothetical protein IT537_06050 [Hyphomicrobiales bacterium]|nr:hypothetical protein [Hyphomicrobiales bacterium]
MRILEAAPDETMFVPGYENQTLECVVCREIERRQVFRGSDAQASSTTGDSEAALAPATAGLEHASLLAEDLLALEGQAASAQQQVQAEPLSDVAVSVAAAPAPAVAGSQVDEAEEMLRRAIAMVRGPLHGSPVRGITEGRPSTPADLASAVRTRKANRIVQIRHDPSYEAAYAAKDTRSGLVVLRHQDSGRLRAMCDRLGWQVIEDSAPAAEE